MYVKWNLRNTHSWGPKFGRCPFKGVPLYHHFICCAQCLEFTLQSQLQSIWRCKYRSQILYIARKFAGELRKFGGLVVGVQTTKLKSAKFVSYAMHNGVMHAVALLAPSMRAVHVASSELAHCQLYFL